MPPVGPTAAAVAPRDASQLPPVSFTVPLSARMTTRCHHGCPPSGGPFPPRLRKGLRGLAFPVTPIAVGEGDALPPAQGPEEAVSQETPPPPPQEARRMRRQPQPFLRGHRAPPAINGHQQPLTAPHRRRPAPAENKSPRKRHSLPSANQSRLLPHPPVPHPPRPGRAAAPCACAPGRRPPLPDCISRDAAGLSPRVSFRRVVRRRGGASCIGGDGLVR